MKHILFADVHEVTRRGVRSILAEAFPAVEICEVHSSDLLQSRIDEQSWNLILLDIPLPSGDVVPAIRGIRTIKPAAPILMFTGSMEPEHVTQTLAAGANGLIHKHCTAQELVDAVTTVANGATYIHPERPAGAATGWNSRSPGMPHHKLSARELEIFRMIAIGRTINEIADELNLSNKTVATYLARTREKTGLSSFVQIARYALKNGLVN